MYQYLTPVPELLPFTYPPFAAILAIPLGLLPPRCDDWLWTLATLACLGWLVAVGFRPLLRRFRPTWRPIATVAVLSATAWTFPVRDCLRYGQVGIFLTALCVMDCALPKTRWPRGMMIGIATWIKLVPGVFIPYLWLTKRRRAAAVAACWFAGSSIEGAIALPQASTLYWTRLLFDPNRLGDNAGISNQSIRGAVLRALPGSAGTALWAVVVVMVAAAGYRWAQAASLHGFEVRGVTLIGLVSVLVSPVSWIHHLAGWVPLAVGVLVGDGRRLRRASLAATAAIYFTLGNSIVGVGSTRARRTMACTQATDPGLVYDRHV